MTTDGCTALATAAIVPAIGGAFTVAPLLAIGLTATGVASSSIALVMRAPCDPTAQCHGRQCEHRDAPLPGAAVGPLVAGRLRRDGRQAEDGGVPDRVRADVTLDGARLLRWRGRRELWGGLVGPVVAVLRSPSAELTPAPRVQDLGGPLFVLPPLVGAHLCHPLTGFPASLGRWF